MKPGRLVGLLLLCLLPLAWAHQDREAITQVLFNPRTGNIEVMHRFLLHDVEVPMLYESLAPKPGGTGPRRLR